MITRLPRRSKVWPVLLSTPPWVNMPTARFTATMRSVEASWYAATAPYAPFPTRLTSEYLDYSRVTGASRARYFKKGLEFLTQGPGKMSRRKLSLCRSDVDGSSTRARAGAGAGCAAPCPCTPPPAPSQTPPTTKLLKAPSRLYRCRF